MTTGQSRNIAVTVTRQGFDKPLTLRAFGACASGIATCQPLPAGIAASFSPATLSGAVLTSTLTLAVAADVRPATVPVLIDANNGEFDAVAPLTVLVAQPSLTVTRNGTGTGTVTSNPGGINCGVTCTASFAVGTNVTLTAAAPSGNAFAGWSGGCSGTTATCALTMTAAMNVTATFSSTVPAFSLAVAPAIDTVPQGGSRTAMVSIARVNGFTGAVNLSVTGAPAGLTVTPNPASVTGDSSTLSIAAPLSLGAGNYHLTLTGTGTGVAQQTATFNVLVTPAAGGSSNVAFSFATCDPTNVPIWFAVQNGSGAWTRVPAGNNSTFSFPVGSNTGVAYVVQNGTAFSTRVLYGSGTELTAIASGDLCRIDAQTGSKRVNGTVVHLPISPVFATLAIGGADTTYHSQTGPNFTLGSIPNGPRDLIAGQHGAIGANGLTPLARLVLRRNVNYPNNANIPQLDMVGAESFAPDVHRVLVNNLGADQQSVSESFITVNGASAPFYEDVGATFGAGPGVRSFGVPDSLLQPGDLHAIQVSAAPPGGNPSSFRFMLMLQHSASDPTVTLGSALATPTVTSTVTTPYLEPRARFQSQSEYSAAASARFEQNANSVEVSATATYFGGTPSTWTLDVPDLTSAGYDPAWGLRAGVPVDWNVSAVGGNVLTFAGAPLFDGAQILGAGRSSSSGAVIGSRPSSFVQWVRRP